MFELQTSFFGRRLRATITVDDTGQSYCMIDPGKPGGGADLKLRFKSGEYARKFSHY
jgi:hypothetical protein